ncbi:PAS domain-containing protein [Suttonella indologenes]|uniref:Aerotaxis receptor n=1 Tax=Suttonella indologenes TaxID=13276 RepID=A0A380MXM5_9GAMM|nr:PAS domain-containing protein [Suttonella indologenes]SUO97032.1 Aerotaxis receptor [Suttonella indologenes]
MKYELPKMEKPPSHTSISSIETAFMEYHDGSSREVFFTDSQYIVPHNMMIVSRTDLDGFITHANADFVDASSYTKEEIIGQPHFFMRHPHMPKAAFADLWTTIQTGGTWIGMVKNLRKDGGYYWVKATVTTIRDKDDNIVGYHSVRRRIDRDTIKEYEERYAQMRAEENA